MESRSISVVTPLVWIGSSRKDMARLAKSVRRLIGYALRTAQNGGKHVDAKPLLGFGGAGVLEVVANHDGNAFRAVYTVRFAGQLYVLHVFQKKSKSGIKTLARDIELVRRRLAVAEALHRDWLAARTRTDHHG